MIDVFDIGSTSYKDAEEKQEKLYKYVLENKDSIDGALLFLELEPVITKSYSSTDDEIKISKENLEYKKISIAKTNRGGKTTIHGPGQMMCYLILNLEKYEKDLHKYLRNLEEVVIDTLGELGINGTRKEKYTGVWVGDEKICAMGIHVKKWITTHGLALNNNIDLSLFDMIIPCGIKEFKVTSLEKLGIEIKQEELKDRFLDNFRKVFNKKE